MDELDTPYALDLQAPARFERDGYIRLRHVLSAPLLRECREELSRVVRRHDTGGVPLAERDTYGKAFTQVFNLWRENPLAERVVRSTRLARIAAQLLDVGSVRLYHDQALYKEPHGGHTPWHCDQFYWPLSSDRTVTAWIPLQPVPAHMGPLGFAVGSHKQDIGRGLAISDDSEAAIGRALQGATIVDAAFELGEVSFHAGWTYHRAASNESDEVRAVFTIIYMDGAMRLVEPDTAERRFDAASWCPGIRAGEIIDSPINPLLYQAPRP